MNDKPKFYEDPQPMQRVQWDGRGVIRFRPNAIVCWMLEKGKKGEGFDLNTIARGDFSGEDYEQLAQLIGYSVSGAGDLSYFSEATTRVADMLAAELSAQGGDPSQQGSER